MQSGGTLWYGGTDQQILQKWKIPKDLEVCKSLLKVAILKKLGLFW